MATKNNVVHHITIKEKNNLPLPKEPEDDFILWHIGTSPKRRDIMYLMEMDKENQFS